MNMYEMKHTSHKGKKEKYSPYNSTSRHYQTYYLKKTSITMKNGVFYLFVSKNDLEVYPEVYVCLMKEIGMKCYVYVSLEMVN